MTEAKIDRLLDMTISQGERVSAIEQHLKDMNGKLVRHDSQLLKCPNVQKELYHKIYDIKSEQRIINYKVAILVSGLVSMANYLINYFIN